MKAEASKFKSQIRDTTSLSVDSKLIWGLNEVFKDDLKKNSSC